MDFHELYEEYKLNHEQLCNLAERSGTRFPVLDQQDGCYYVHPQPGVGRVKWNPNRTDSWDHNFSKLIDKNLLETMGVLQNNLASLQDTEEGLTKYFDFMSHPTMIHQLQNGSVIYQSSAEGVKKVPPLCEYQNKLSVSLEFNAPNPLPIGNFVHVPLDDSTPMMKSASIDENQFRKFLYALEQAHLAAKIPGCLIVVNCSQGQSRSGMFVVCLLMLLEKDPEFVKPPLLKSPSNQANWLEPLCSWYKMVNHERDITTINPKFIPFLMFIAKCIHCRNFSPAIIQSQPVSPPQMPIGTSHQANDPEHLDNVSFSGSVLQNMTSGASVMHPTSPKQAVHASIAFNNLRTVVNLKEKYIETVGHYQKHNESVLADLERRLLEKEKLLGCVAAHLKVREEHIKLRETQIASIEDQISQREERCRVFESQILQKRAAIENQISEACEHLKNCNAPRNQSVEHSSE